MKENSSTVPKQLKPFIKGDPRINRNGRPKGFDALRDLARSIADEKALDKHGDPILDRNGKALTNAQMVLRRLMIDEPTKFLEISYGKIPQPIEIEGEVKLTIEKMITDDPAK